MYKIIKVYSHKLLEGGLNTKETETGDAVNQVNIVPSGGPGSAGL